MAVSKKQSSRETENSVQVHCSKKNAAKDEFKCQKSKRKREIGGDVDSVQRKVGAYIIIFFFRFKVEILFSFDFEKYFCPFRKVNLKYRLNRPMNPEWKIQKNL